MSRFARSDLMWVWRALIDLRNICVSLNLIPLNAPTVDIAEAQKKFDANGNLADAPTRDLRQLATALVEVTLRLNEARERAGRAWSATGACAADTTGARSYRAAIGTCRAMPPRNASMCARIVRSAASPSRRHTASRIASCCFWKLR